MGRLDNKVAIITGGAKGMGASHVQRFVQEGAKVVIADILEEEGKAFAEKLGDNVIFVKHDVSKEEDWVNVVSQAEKAFGPVNILVNNAGIAGAIKPLEEYTLDEYLKVININQVSVFLGMKTVISSMKKAEGGSIVNISSASGLIGTAGQVAYDSSKFAVRGMTKTATMEFSKYGVRVNSVHPGPIDTGLMTPEMAKQYGDYVPLKRVASPSEVSNLVLYLASDEASFSTGSEFIVDGGLTAQ